MHVDRRERFLQPVGHMGRQQFVQRSGNHARMIGGLRQVFGQFAFAEIDHALGRGLHQVVPFGRVGADIVVHLLFDIMLEIQQREGTCGLVLLRFIPRLDGHHDAGIGPFGITGGIGHAVEYQGLRLRGRRDQDAARAHAEREDAPLDRLTVRTRRDDLLDETVFRRRHAGLPLAAVTDLVDQRLRMLHPHAHRETLGLQFPALVAEQFVDIAGGMARRQDDGSGLIGHFLRFGTVLVRHLHIESAGRLEPGDVFDPGVEMVFSAMFLDAAADVLHHLREFVRPDMRMGIDQDGPVGAESDELVQDFTDVSPLGGTGEQFAVRESAGTAFAVAVIRIRIHDTGPGQAGHVGLPGMNVLSPLQHDRPETQHQQFQRCEHAGRSGTDHDDRFRIRNILIGSRLVFLVFVILERLDPIDHLYVAPRIDGTVDNAADRIRTDHGRLIGLGRVNDVDDGAAAETQLFGGLPPDVVQARFAAHRTGDIKSSHIKNLTCGKPGRHPRRSARRPGNGNNRRWQSSRHYP